VRLLFSLLPGNACSSLSFSPPCVFEKWALCALEEAKESPGGSLPLGSNVMMILWDGRAADEDDEYWEKDEEEVSEEV
jgi:hypothetical protein